MTIMSTIKAIEQQTVHQICSGQVILDLATAVKELVENSVDAGATAIDIKLKEFGRTSIEVSDNGQGVEESNFAGLTLKHHTSKLQDFSDLTSVETFGFRGEALSSLCALCSLCVTTRHGTAKVAQKLEFDNNGEIMKKTNTARQCGTTVVLKDIFYTLPVRRKEFEKNIKKEYTKLLSLLNAYCLISTGVRISCSNETGKGNRSTVITTSGVGTISDNVSTLFGSKQYASLMQFKQVQPALEVCESYIIKYEEAVDFCEQCKISGYISSCGPGLGRNSNDRQFYSVNKRPCELQKVAKVVNEVFHMFNRHQYPFVQIDISTNRHEIDVNVTPDKRKIFMQREKFILAIIKSSLLEMYNGQQHAIGLTKPPVATVSVMNDCSMKRFLEKHDKQHPCPDPLVQVQPKKGEQRENNSISSSKIDKNQKISLSKFYRTFSSAISSAVATNNIGKRRYFSNESSGHSVKHRRIDSVFTTLMPSENGFSDKNSIIFIDVEKSDKSVLTEIQKDKENLTKDKSRSVKVVTDIPDDQIQKKVHNIPFCFNAVKNNLIFKRTLLAKKTQNVVKGDHGALFKAKISSDENKRAEDELSKFFTKSSFENMQILGQFNLGFIIARYLTDLFIIDQHASDEKYNFETLQKTTSLHGQPLIIPQKLELTAGERLVMIDNATIFKKNGFDFRVEKCDNAQDVVYLTKVPSSRNCTFDASDVSEMIFMLTDASHVLCRPSRVRQMFASRACRKSVMVGTALTKNEMKKLVSHMAELDQPWNCPHGRPTMRHLADLSMITKPEIL